MATLIASQAKSGVSPKAVHAGVNAVRSVYSLTATLAAADIIQMCKLPDGARIVDVQLGHEVAIGVAGKLNVGIRADHDGLIASASVATANRVWGVDAAGLGKRYDISDDASVRFTMVEIKASDFTGTGTKSGAISLVVSYTVDEGG